MSHWNYRICKETYGKGTPYEEVGYTIREAYYNNDGEIWAVTEGSKGVHADDLNGIKTGLDWMMLALGKEVVDLDTIVFAKN